MIVIVGDCRQGDDFDCKRKFQQFFDTYTWPKPSTTISQSFSMMKKHVNTIKTVLFFEKKCVKIYRQIQNKNEKKPYPKKAKNRNNISSPKTSVHKDLIKTNCVDRFIIIIKQKKNII